MKGHTLDKVISALIAVILFLVPLFLLPVLLDFELGKKLFLLIATLVLLILWAVKIVLEKKIIYKKSVVFYGLLGLLAVFFVSTFVNAPNKVMSLTSGYGALTLTLLVLTFLLVKNLANIKTALFGLLAGGAILSAITITLFLGSFTFPLNFPSLNLSISQSFSASGSLLTQAVALLLMLPVGLSLLFEEVRAKRNGLALSAFVLNVLIAVGLGISVYLLTTSAKAILLPASTAWAIALETIKNGRFALIGLSPGQFTNAFTSFKPLLFNSSDYWNLRFASSSNWYYQLITEVGILGLLVYLFTAFKIVKGGLKSLRQALISNESYVNSAIVFSVMLSLAIQFFLPVSFFLFFLFFVLIALVKESDEEAKTTDLAPLGKLIFLIFIFPLAIWGALAFFFGKAGLANYYYLQSLKEINNNQAVRAYDLQIKAIATDISQPTYRIGYSQTNFALANSLASKKDLTDQDRNTITQLIQQSIREAKAAVSIDPNNVSSWENLANIYRNLINFAEGADQWTVATYQQAINLDPINPLLRIDFGGLYYSARNWDQAINLFAQAVNLKQDYANAHYNLANALREKGSLAEAKGEYEVTQSLVKIDTADYQKVTAELEEVKKRLAPTPSPVKKAITPETLSIPQPPAAGITPPIELPNEGPVIPQ